MDYGEIYIHMNLHTDITIYKDINNYYMKKYINIDRCIQMKKFVYRI